MLLSSVCRELAELHKARASRDSEAQEVALSRETQAREQLSVSLEKAQEEARLQQEALANQVTPWAWAMETHAYLRTAYTCTHSVSSAAYLHLMQSGNKIHWRAILLTITVRFEWFC